MRLNPFSSTSELPALIELKIAAGRGHEEADVIQLMRVNIHESDTLRKHLVDTHPAYTLKFDHLLERAKAEEELWRGLFANTSPTHEF